MQTAIKVAEMHYVNWRPHSKNSFAILCIVLLKYINCQSDYIKQTTLMYVPIIVWPEEVLQPALASIFLGRLLWKLKEHEGLDNEYEIDM